MTSNYYQLMDKNEQIQRSLTALLALLREGNQPTNIKPHELTSRAAIDEAGYIVSLYMRRLEEVRLELTALKQLPTTPNTTPTE